MTYDAELYIIMKNGQTYIISGFIIYYWHSNHKELSTALIIMDIMLALANNREYLNEIEDIIINDITDPNNPVPVTSYYEWYKTVNLPAYAYFCKNKNNFYTDFENILSVIDAYDNNELSEKPVIHRNILGPDTNEKYFRTRKFTVQIDGRIIDLISEENLILSSSNIFRVIDFNKIHDFIKANLK